VRKKRGRNPDRRRDFAPVHQSSVKHLMGGVK
jgi:hypothetical protein